MSAHTPWNAEPYDETGGYDCMTGAIRIGPAVLDGAEYGQELNHPIDPDALRQMEADARLIAAATDLLHALETLLGETEDGTYMTASEQRSLARAAIAKARGAA